MTATHLAEAVQYRRLDRNLFALGEGHMDSAQDVYLESRRYLWQYFEMHAGQRLKSFNFFLIMCAVLASGYLVVLQEHCGPCVGLLLGALFVFLSFVFWKLDRRNRDLIQYAEKGLMYLEEKLSIVTEEDGRAAVLRIFTFEKERTEAKKKRKSYLPWSYYLTYARCFNLVFVAIGSLGVAAFVYSVYLVVTRAGGVSGR